MRTSAIVVFLTLGIAGCGGAGDAVLPVESIVDAASDVPTNDARAEAGTDAQTAIDGSTALDGGAEPSSEASPRPDARPAMDPPETSAPEDAPITAIDAGPETAVVDVRASDAGATVEAGADAGLVCPGPPHDCDAINREAADIRKQFTQPCTTGDQKCGGVIDSAALEMGQTVVVTLPMECKAGAWTLSGVWVASRGVWSAGFTCSHGCAAKALCAP